MEGRHFPRRRNEKLIAINTKIYVNIRERPIETKEVHCTTAYERKSVNFQWTVTREMVMLEAQQPFSSYTFPEMKALFGLKADDCNEFLEHPSTSQAPMKPPITKLSEIRERLNYTRILNGSLQRQFMLKEKDFFYVSNEEIGNAIERSLKFEGLEEAWIISQKKKSFNNNSLEKIKLIFEPPSNNVSLNEEVLKNKAKDCYENDKEG
ncbi:hypothetical protein GLOIN_2v1767555 [Rhizophagus irregularis DAOM 181602=DAOM 197198]|uniref:Uncharacterized protein n=1 Tax=Rhizophagus irregularis (strain DAOM 181602 / DAOM 197198 / MUCL 43194) TaxID=747089 RepID=A0A2P4QJ90_RHIID|nr:hypothetical protein GLOIN_2v1767555 [Rhizophagus irregularis DAOM 181602=DAOM 197198]POG77719.1 hypothetical protein GLOIN_2v1767555 [Rhizophagus irregularis DAOM 181602=DAOM 197198]|eukprot:XP_025184585.1 hypothetical protein GLOIN_2v1767555 [Rhizophagus irregularis DAOM 181602=DAOM 197198]